MRAQTAQVVILNRLWRFVAQVRFIINGIVTRDEAWVHYYDYELKQESTK